MIDYIIYLIIQPKCQWFSSDIRDLTLKPTKSFCLVAPVNTNDVFWDSETHVPDTLAVIEASGFTLRISFKVYAITYWYCSTSVLLFCWRLFIIIVSVLVVVVAVTSASLQVLAHYFVAIVASVKSLQTVPPARW